MVMASDTRRHDDDEKEEEEEEEEEAVIRTLFCLFERRWAYNLD
jgi:ribosomal protein L12E/L44/L45/RPP1/RPP2